MITVKDIIEATKYNFTIENSKGITIYSSFHPESYDSFNDDTKVVSLSPQILYTRDKYIMYIKIVVD